MSRNLVRTFVFATLLGVLFAASASAKNMIPDPDFKKFAEGPIPQADAWKKHWIPFQIMGPSQWKVQPDAGAVELKGGKTFLHSPRFKVEVGQKLTLALTAKGKGKVSIQCLYWTAEGGMADTHRTVVVKPVKVEGKKKDLQGTDTVPEGAAEAYIRIVVEDGTLTVSDPTVMPAG